MKGDPRPSVESLGRVIRHGACMRPFARRLARRAAIDPNPPRSCFSLGVQRLSEPAPCRTPIAPPVGGGAALSLAVWQRIPGPRLFFCGDGARRRMSGILPSVCGLHVIEGPAETPTEALGLFRPPPPKRARSQPNQLDRFYAVYRGARDVGKGNGIFDFSRHCVRGRLRRRDDWTGTAAQVAGKLTTGAQGT